MSAIPKPSIPSSSAIMSSTSISTTPISSTPDADRKHMSEAALRTFFRIAQAWGLDGEQQRILLGGPARSTFFQWKRGVGAALQRDILERISYVLGIYSALQLLLPNPDAADSWVRRPNTAAFFAGRSALDVMLSGNVGDLFLVRQYLDAQRGGWN
jgi:Protein of unknown function (DUF2384)